MLFLPTLIKQEHPEFAFDFESKLNEAGVSYSYIYNTHDLWLRDFMPIQVGANEFAQFALAPDYYYKKDLHKKTDPAPICKTLGIEPTPIVYNGIPIHLDGGNVIRGFGKAIITEKVLKDNRITKDVLTRLLIEALHVDEIIFVPIEPHDDTGHADGMVRFVDERTVVANDYLENNVPQDFRDRFYGAFDEAGMEVLLVPYNPSEELINDYQSAAGCYINFLKIRNKVFLPTFEDPVNNALAIKRFEEIYGLRNIVPIPSQEVAKGGGVLNCLSWEISIDGE